MRRNVVGIILITLLVVGALGAIGFGVYQLGFERGLVESGTDIVVNRVGPGLRHAYDGWGPGFFGGFGFGLFGLLFKILIFALIVGLIARLFWGPRRWGGGPWGGGWRDEHTSPMEHRLTEWHDKAHGERPGEDPKPDTGA